MATTQNVLQKSSNGTPVTDLIDSLIYDNGTNVGIGTPGAASRLLEIYATWPTVKVSGTTTSDGGFGDIVFYNRAGSSGISAVHAGFRAVRDGGNDKVSLAFLVPTGNNDSPQEAMRLSWDGKLGIGTASPSVPFHVSNSSSVLARFERPTAGGEIQIYGSSTSYASINLNYASNKMQMGPYGQTSALVIDSNGNVGVGATSPGDMLVVNGQPGNIQLGARSFLGSTYSAQGTVLGNAVRAQQGTNSNRMVYSVSDSIGASAILQDDGAIKFHTIGGSTTAGNTFNSERMRIDSSGNIGIGTTSPSQMVELVNGNLLVDRGTLLTTTEPIPSPLTATVQASSGNLGIGNYYYKVTFITAQGETDVSLASTVAITTSGHQQISLTSIATGTAGIVTARRIYRTKVGGASFLLLATISDNSTTTYSDNVSDASLGSSAPLSNTTAGAVLEGTMIVRYSAGIERADVLAAENAPNLNFRRGSGVVPLVGGWHEGAINFFGWDGNTFRRSAYILCITEGNPTSGEVPGAIAFFTTPSDEVTNLQERLRITKDGNVLIGLTSADDSQVALQILRNQNTGVWNLVRNANTGTAAYPAVVARSGAYNSTNDVTMGVTSSGFTPASGLSASQGFIKTGSQASNGLVLQSSAGSIDFQPAGSQACRMDTSGNLLIGLTSADDSQVALQILRNQNTGVWNLVRNANTGTAAYPAVVARSGAYNSTNDVTMGVTSSGFTPASGLSASQGFIKTGSQASNGLVLQSSAGSIDFQPAGSQACRMDTSGNLLIGLTSADDSQVALQILRNQNTGVWNLVRNANTGTAAYPAVVARSGAYNSTNDVTMGVTSSGFTPASGLSASQGFIKTGSSASNGLVLNPALGVSICNRQERQRN